jgi:hypothetical protein
MFDGVPPGWSGPSTAETLILIPETVGGNRRTGDYRWVKV